MANLTKSKILHLGCGNNKVKNAIGVDINQRTKADIIHDLNTFPYPFSANRFDTIVAEHIIEHLDDLVKVMEEIYRVAKPKAKVFITSSHFSSVDSYTDITHKHFLTSHSFDYFIPGTPLHNLKYSQAKYNKKNVYLGPHHTSNLFIKTILKLINRYPDFYEARLAFIFPIGVIYYHLEVDK